MTSRISLPHLGQQFPFLLIKKKKKRCLSRLDYFLSQLLSGIKSTECEGSISIWGTYLSFTPKLSINYITRKDKVKASKTCKLTKTFIMCINYLSREFIIINQTKDQNNCHLMVYIITTIIILSTKQFKENVSNQNFFFRAKSKSS